MWGFSFRGYGGKGGEILGNKKDPSEMLFIKGVKNYNSLQHDLI